MKWLVTFKKQFGRHKVMEQLQSFGCAVLNSDHAVTMGGDEEVLSVEGPGDLPQLAEPHKNIMKIYPNSKLSKY